MFLSRLMLNLHSREVQRDLNNPDQMHRTILSAYPSVDTSDEGARSQFKVLYRVDTDRSTGAVAVTVQSSLEPDWSALPDSYLIDRPGNPACKSIASLYEGIESGAILRFRLRATPTRSEGLNGKKGRGKKVAILDTPGRLAWLLRRADEFGFELPRDPNAPHGIRVALRSEGWVAMDRQRKTESNQVCFNSASFEGLIRVRDPEAFRRGLQCGIGRGKAYGFGLLQVAPVGHFR